MNNLRHKKYKNKQLNNTKVLKVKNSTQKLENNVKPIKISIIDMDKILKKVTKKITFTKAIWCDWYDSLIHYISDLIKKRERC